MVSHAVKRLPLLLLIFSLMPLNLPLRDSRHAPVSKSLDDYWEDTDLTAADIDVVLRHENCSQSHRKFLACINALSTLAEKLGLVMNLDGTLRPVEGAGEPRLSERDDLKKWTTALESTQTEDNKPVPRFNFEHVFQDLKSRIPQNRALTAFLAGALNSYYSVAEDPHSYILPLAYYDEVASRPDTRSLQTGFVARRTQKGAIIRKVFRNSPAERAGLKKGDLIVGLNGKEVKKLHSSYYSELIRGSVGERLLILAERKEGEKLTRKHYELKREEFQYSSVESRIQSGPRTLGLLTIHKFASETCKLVRSHLINLMEQSIAGLMIDLRDNPGGQVDEAACVLNLFLPQQTALFETRYLDGIRKSEVYVADRPHLYDGPIAVLINAGSASASEIVAGVLKDYDRAILVGERSFGKGSFQDGSLWRPSSRVALFKTQGFYYFPSGWTPQLVGLYPDIPVTLTESESLREEDLYLVPLRPKDFWNGPQTLAWLHKIKCPDGRRFNSEDAQLAKAEEWIQCGAGSDSSNSSGDRSSTQQ